MPDTPHDALRYVINFLALSDSMAGPVCAPYLTQFSRLPMLASFITMTKSVPDISCFLESGGVI
jgi:hypothetical protein